MAGVEPFKFFGGNVPIDWSLVAKIAGGGFGVTILVLVILSLVVLIVGLVLQRSARGKKGEAKKDKS